MMCRASSFIASPRERPGFGRRRAPGATDGHDCTGPFADPPAAARATALVRPFRLHSLHATGDAAERRDRLDLDPNDREVGHPDGGKQRGHSLPMYIQPEGPRPLLATDVAGGLNRVPLLQRKASWGHSLSRQRARTRCCPSSRRPRYVISVTSEPSTKRHGGSRVGDADSGRSHGGQDAPRTPRRESLVPGRPRACRVGGMSDPPVRRIVRPGTRPFVGLGGAIRGCSTTTARARQPQARRTADAPL